MTRSTNISIAASASLGNAGTWLSKDFGLLSFFAEDSTKESILHKVEYGGQDLTCEVLSPRKYGLPTVADSDLIQYLAGLLRLRMQEPDFDVEAEKSRTFVFTATDYFRATQRTSGKQNYSQLELTFNRLRTASISTNLFNPDGSGATKPLNWFGEGTVFERRGDGAVHLRVVLPKWVISGLISDLEIFTQIPDQFYSLPISFRRIFHVLLGRLRAGEDALIVPMPDFFEMMGPEDNRARNDRIVKRIKQMADEDIPVNRKRNRHMAMPLFQVAIFDSEDDAEQGLKQGITTGNHATMQRASKLVCLFTRINKAAQIEKSAAFG